jgi:hypothetical protein
MVVEAIKSRGNERNKEQEICGLLIRDMTVEWD